MVDVSAVFDSVKEQVMFYVPKLLYAIIVLVIGLFIIRGIRKLVLKFFEKKDFDPSVETFLASLITITLKILLVISVISMLGIQMTSFVAIIGAAGLAVGLSLQGSLANFAGGVLILSFKPFKVGDYIDGAGHSGTVSQIQIFNTVLKTPDNKTIIIPNGGLSNASIVNYSMEKKRRVDLSFGISYDDDLKKAKKVLQKIVDADKRILRTPESFIRLGELGDSSVNITLRLWVKAEDYWDVSFDMKESVKFSFDKNKISFPYPQMDVHMKKK